MRTSDDTAREHLSFALTELSQRTGISMAQVCSTCVGTAGNGIPLVVDWLHEELTARVGGRLILVGDIEIALDAAFFGDLGVLVLSGTGSNVAGRSRSGIVETVGGWGPQLGDNDSGYAIGHQALRNLAFSMDRVLPLLEVLGHGHRTRGVSSLFISSLRTKERGGFELEDLYFGIILYVLVLWNLFGLA